MTGSATDPGGAGGSETARTEEFSRPPVDADLTDLLSSDSGFRVGMRGYDREQVDKYRSRIEAELAAARTAHDGAMRAQAQTTERLRAVQRDLDRLRNQLTNSPTALSERLREILQLADQDA